MKKNELITKTTSSNMANTLHALADAIEEGTIQKYRIEHGKNSLNISIDSSDGTERIITQQVEMNGYMKNSREHIQKQSPEERREVVQQLNKEGLTQKEIAERTMCSQKTISNDIKKLREDKKI